MRWKKVEEIKGKGMHAFDNDGNEYWAGSYKVAETLTKDGDHNVYVVKNGSLVGWLDVQDEIRPETAKVIDYLHSKKIKTILLSGDRRYKCE
jgi:Cu+-exporting ATPase